VQLRKLNADLLKWLPVVIHSLVKNVCSSYSCLLFTSDDEASDWSRSSIGILRTLGAGFDTLFQLSKRRATRGPSRKLQSIRANNSIYFLCELFMFGTCIFQFIESFQGWWWFTRKNRIHCADDNSHFTCWSMTKKQLIWYYRVQESSILAAFIRCKVT